MDKYVRFFSELPSFPSDLTLWEVLNSNLLSGLLLAIVGGVFTIVFKNDSDKRQRDEADKSKADEEASEAQAISIASGRQSFKAAVEIIDDLKGRVENRVEHSDKRHKRTYAKTPRYDYVRLVDLMEERGLPAKVAALLRDGFNAFRPYKNGRRDVPLPVLEQLTKIQKDLDSLGFRAASKVVA